MDKDQAQAAVTSFVTTVARKAIRPQNAGARKEMKERNQKGNSKRSKHVSGLENGESAEAGAEPAPEAFVGLFLRKNG